VTFLSTGPSSCVSFAADVNGDGKLDLLGSNGANFQVFLGNGDGTFTALPPVTAAVGGIAAVADFNGDGKLDLLLNDSSPSEDGGLLTVLLGNGDGTFSAPTTIVSTRVGGFSFVTIGDFNNDKRQDIALSLGSIVAIKFFPIGGVFTLLNATPADFSISSVPSSVSIAGPGQSATATATVTAAGGFAGTVNLSCSVTPSNQMKPPTCSLTPNSVTIGAGSSSGTATLMIQTSPSAMASSQGGNRFGLFAWASSSVALAFFVFPCVRKGKEGFLLSLAAVALLLPIAGCGGGSGSSGTTPGSYTVTVTAASGTVSHAINLSVTLQ
jgi:hypothetical protein